MRKAIYCIKRHCLPFFIGGGALVFFALYIIRSFSDFYFPAEGIIRDPICRFFSENFSFFTLPHFEWHTDWFCYPYGVDITYLMWGMGMGVIETLIHSISGHYLPCQWLYLYSLAVTYFGVYALVQYRKGRFWATVFAFVLTFCNYASICKFPGHFAHCIVHWMILSMLTDVIMVEKYWAREKFSATFILGKVLLLFLSLGLEMGYVAGLACFSFFISCFYLIVVQVFTDRSFSGTSSWFCGLMRNLVLTFRDRKVNYIMAGAILVVAWIYLPIIFQISSHAFAAGKTIIWNANINRLLLPIFPGFNPATQNSGSFAYIDTIFAWNVGWTFICVFLIGLVWGIRENSRKWIPFVAMLVMILTMHRFPILSMFPAFKSVRITERFSLYLIFASMIPLYFACSCISWQSFLNFWRTRSFLWPIIPLFLVEVITAYNHTFVWATAMRLRSISDEYNKAVSIVRDLPGEAIFFFPFSVHGGEGNGFKKYHFLTAPQMQFAAHARKKMNGGYLGRMPSSYLQEFGKFDWPYYVQNEVWSSNRWSQLETFFSNTDFCAIILNRNRLSNAQRQDIIKHIGHPIARFSILGEPYEVINMPTNLRGVKKLSEIQKLHAIPEEIGEGDIFFSRSSERVQLKAGFQDREPWGVWSTEEKCSMCFTLPRGENPVSLIFKAQAYHKVRSVVISCNAEKVAEWVNPVIMQQKEYAVPIPTKYNGKRIILSFAQKDVVSPHQIDCRNNDARTLGMGFVSVRLERAIAAKERSQ